MIEPRNSKETDLGDILDANMRVESTSSSIEKTTFKHSWPYWRIFASIMFFIVAGLSLVLDYTKWWLPLIHFFTGSVWIYQHLQIRKTDFLTIDNEGLEVFNGGFNGPRRVKIRDIEKITQDWTKFILQLKSGNKLRIYEKMILPDERPRFKESMLDLMNKVNNET